MKKIVSLMAALILLTLAAVFFVTINVFTGGGGYIVQAMKDEINCRLKAIENCLKQIPALWTTLCIVANEALDEGGELHRY